MVAQLTDIMLRQTSRGSPAANTSAHFKAFFTTVKIDRQSPCLCQSLLNSVPLKISRERVVMVASVSAAAP